ncbi:MAG: hypothetical protein ACJA0K_000361 [Maricaulis maris]|jgi:hypothetical protein
MITRPQTRQASLIRTLIVPCLVGIAGSAAAADDGDLDWLAGHWKSGGDDPVIEEIWTDGAGGLLLGLNRTQVGGQAVAFEFLRIERTPTGSRYCAQPGGRPATCFELTTQSASSARFENPDNDFPQIIEYRRDGRSLTATIADLSGEQAMVFSWERVGD